MTDVMTERTNRIRYLLDHWEAIFDGSPSPEPFSAIRGSSASSCIPGRLPKMASHVSVKELERCLRLLASANPGDYRHLKVFRCAAEWRNVDTWRRVKLPSGKHDWDVAAADLICAEAGAVVSDHKGRTFRYNREVPRQPALVCAGPLLHPLLVERVSHMELD